jgi:hypothetical protein
MRVISFVRILDAMAFPLLVEEPALREADLAMEEAALFIEELDVVID